MFKIALQSLLARKLRLVTTALAVILGVAFTAGTLVLTDTMSSMAMTGNIPANEPVRSLARAPIIGPIKPAKPHAVTMRP